MARSEREYFRARMSNGAAVSDWEREREREGEAETGREERVCNRERRESDKEARKPEMEIRRLMEVEKCTGVWGCSQR